jgi:hypothetical protein
MKLRLNKLIEIANELDIRGLTKEADVIDSIITKYSDYVFNAEDDELLSDDFSDLIAEEESFKDRINAIKSASRLSKSAERDDDFGRDDIFTDINVEDISNEDFRWSMDGAKIDDIYNFEDKSPEEKAVIMLSGHLNITYDELLKASEALGKEPQDFLIDLGFSEEDASDLIEQSMASADGSKLYSAPGIFSPDLLKGEDMDTDDMSDEDIYDLKEDGEDDFSNFSMDSMNFMDDNDFSNLWDE